MNSIAEAVSNLANTVPSAGLPDLGTCSTKVSIGEESFSLTIGSGTIHAEPVRAAEHDWDFTYSVDDQTWEKFCSNPPPRGYTSAQAIFATLGGGCVAGDRTVWARYATVLDRTFEALRGLTCGPRPDRNATPKAPTESRSPIVGGYLQLTVDGGGHRVYYESAGEGQPVLCLHTAGADSRQFRYLLEDAELTSRFRFVAFDMPWHGRSDPPDDWTTTKYTLDTNTYAETILAFMDELGLDRPILVGCSMGGAIALLMASRHGERFQGVCALEGGLGNPGRFVPWTNHIEVDHSHFLTSWVSGLIAPSSPAGPRNQTLWGYAQSGPGVYQGDTYFYSTDFPKHAANLGPAECPLWVFSGEYDYSATTEMSRDAAGKLGGQLVVMQGSGHFPMSEDPVVFRSYLVPVLDKLSPVVSGD
jgi:pimeloyl-ACP methyl ester carboxylesterase